MGSCNLRSSGCKVLDEPNGHPIIKKNRTPVTISSIPSINSKFTFASQTVLNNRNFSVEGLFPFSTEEPFFEKLLITTGLNPTAFFSQSGITVTCRKGLKPEPNQDNFFITNRFPHLLVGVFDGHGEFGHNISSLARKIFPRIFFEDIGVKTNYLQILQETFRKVHDLIIEKSKLANIDCSCSGCTATIILISDGKLYAAHLGDSKALLIIDYESKLRAVPLTTDHKLSSPIEKTRVINSGGLVKKVVEDNCERVYVPDRTLKGLSVTRALGDCFYQDRGVTFEPECSEKKIEKWDRFVVVGSDGVWDVISNGEIAEVLMENLENPCNFIANKAWGKWIENGYYVDDITLLIIPIKINE